MAAALFYDWSTRIEVSFNGSACKSFLLLDSYSAYKSERVLQELQKVYPVFLLSNTIFRLQLEDARIIMTRNDQYQTYEK